jgi:hypothetical protein
MAVYFAPAPSGNFREARPTLVGTAGIVESEPGIVPYTSIDPFETAAELTAITAAPPTAQVGRFDTLRKRVRNYAIDVARAVVLRASGLLPYEAGQLDARDMVEPRQWMAQYYVKNGNAKPGTVDQGGDLLEDGTLGPRVDPYLSRSPYYGVLHKRKNSLLMGARLILPDEESDQPPADTLQIHIHELPKEHQERIHRLGGALAELSAYIKKPNLGIITRRLAGPFLLKAVMQGALDKGKTHVVFAFNPAVAKDYERVFGNVMIPLGESVGAGAFKSQFKPYMIDIVSGVKDARSSRKGVFKTPAGYTLNQFFGSLLLPGERDTKKR